MKKVILLVFMFSPFNALAGWSFNLGYNNPPGAVLGVNLMHIWTEWAFEIGMGYAKTYTDDNGKQITAIAGGLNGKYLFMSGDFRPYLQAGTGWGTSLGGGTANVGVGGGLHVGGGFFVMASSVYAYGSYNVTNRGESFPQAGLGFNF